VDSQVGRFLISKRYHGGMEASAVGEMLAVRTATEGSAGYVAMERVSGTLDHRAATGTLNHLAGSFILQHTGSMNRGAQSISVTIVADSGTGDLTGISGELKIEQSGGVHRYRLIYDLPADRRE